MPCLYFTEEDVDDFGRQDIQDSLREVVDLSSRLADTFEGTKRRQEGYLIALVGRSNVGKSTLLNTLLGEDRAIVTPIPGTTRDLVEGRTIWSGDTVRLVDTAGVRQTNDPIEVEGIKRAAKSAQDADVVFAIFDSSTPWCEDDQAVLDLLPFDKSIFIFNKIDLASRLDRTNVEKQSSSVVEISALTELGIDELKRETSRHMPRPKDVDGVGISRRRHQDCLFCVVKSTTAALELLVSGQPDECAVFELREALSSLGEMIGENIDEDVLNSIFSEFCVGK